MAKMFVWILIISTLVTGCLWCMDKFIHAQKRHLYKDKEIQANDRLNKKRLGGRIGSGSALSWMETSSSIFPVLATVLVIRSFIFEPFQIPSGSMIPTLLIGDFILVEKFIYGIRDPVYQKVMIKTSHPERGDIVVFQYPKDQRFAYIKRVIGLPGDKITYDPIAKEITIWPDYIHHAIINNAQPITYSDIELSDFIQNFTRSGNGKESSNFFQFQLLKEWDQKNSIRMIERKETIGNVTHRILTVPILQDQLDMYYRQKNQPFATWIVPSNHYFMMGDNRDNSADSRYWGFVSEENLIGKAIFIWMSFEKKEGEWPTGIRLSRIGWIH